MTEQSTELTAPRGAGVDAMMEANDPFVKRAAASASLGLELLRFSGNTGEFTYDQEVLPKGEIMAFNMAELKEGFMCWKGGKPVGHFFQRIADSLVMPAIETMEDLGPYAAQDGWKPAFRIQVSDLEGNEMELTTSSWSGCLAFEKLMQKYGQQRRLHLDDDGGYMIPLVPLASETFPIKAGGVKWKPVFVIDSWESVQNLSTAATQGMEPGEATAAQITEEAAKAEEEQPAKAAGVTRPASSSRGRRLRG